MEGGPKTRSGSDILANIQDTQAPLDKPIRFGKTPSRKGKVERTSKGRKFVSTQEYTYNKHGEVVPVSEMKLAKWAGKYHRIHKDICG